MNWSLLLEIKKVRDFALKREWWIELLLFGAKAAATLVEGDQSN